MCVCILVGKWHMHPCCLNALESFELKLIGRIYIYIYIYAEMQITFFMCWVYFDFGS